MFGIGGWELLLIFVIILLLFGAKRLPEIARSLGKSIGEFKKTKDEFMNYNDTAPEDKKKEEDVSEYTKAEKDSEKEDKEESTEKKES
jgi:sec-independent protein translocase protein TatA